jgi:hypothetical protein
MGSLAEIERLFNKGDYLCASKMADEYRVADSRNVCQNLSGIVDIADAIDHSLAITTSLEDKINNYESEIRNLKGVAMQMEEKEHAVEVQCKNLEDTCALIDDLIENLHISDQVETILLEGDLNDESSIEHVELALNELDRVLNYKIDSSLVQMKCVRDQRERAKVIKSSFRERFYYEYDSYLKRSQNGLDSLEFLTRLSRYISAQKRSNQFLLQIYGEVTMKVKRNFDQFMEQKLDTIRRFKQPKQAKCGVLSIIKEFEEFANQVETLFEATGSRRPELDRWYPDMVTELFRIIDTIEHKSTPTEMIRLENYKYLHDLLSSIKVPCLRLKRTEAKMQYEMALNAYVTRYFGRPLEKINIFFDGVQAKVAQGVKEEEISFQLAFSKQELRRVLQLVTLKEVRKGLEEMYRHIEKHAFEPKSNLIEVIWHAMQTEFLSQYKAIQSMIERCYPSSNLGLTFTIDNVLQVFSDIAQSH